MRKKKEKGEKSMKKYRINEEKTKKSCGLC